MAFRLPRRAVLKGLGGAAVALPALEIMLDSSGKAYASGSTIPSRYVVCFDGQSLGADRDTGPSQYIPDVVGPGYDLKPALAPLAAVQGDVSVVSGLHI